MKITFNVADYLTSNLSKHLFIAVINISRLFIIANIHANIRSLTISRFLYKSYLIVTFQKNTNYLILVSTYEVRIKIKTCAVFYSY